MAAIWGRALSLRSRGTTAPFAVKQSPEGMSNRSTVLTLTLPAGFLCARAARGGWAGPGSGTE